MGNFLEKFFETISMVLVGFLVFIFLLLVFFTLPKGGKKDVINELCQKQQYDFCEVDKITYKLKDRSNGTIHK